MRWKALDRAMNLSLVPAQGDAFFQVFFCDAVLGFGALGPTFSSTSFPSIDAVGSKILTRLHEYIDCDTHRRAPNNSSIELLNVRVLDFDLDCLLNDQIPPHRSHFSWSLPLALKLGEHFMSTSMVTLTRALSMTRPASRARRWR